MADHHPRVDAARHLLPVPLDRLSLRNLEEIVQVQIVQSRLRLSNRSIFKVDLVFIIRSSLSLPKQQKKH